MIRALRPLLGVFLVLSLFLLSCGDDDPAGPASGSVVVTGTVVGFYDETPSDGPITITVTTQGGDTDHLLFLSFFNNPLPPDQASNLYDLVRRVEVGDLVRGEGKRTTNGIQLEALAILNGHS